MPNKIIRSNKKCWMCNRDIDNYHCICLFNNSDSQVCHLFCWLQILKSRNDISDYNKFSEMFKLYLKQMICEDLEIV